VYRPPVSLVALRSVVFGGAAWARGYRLTPADLKLKNVQVAIAKGWVGTLPELYGRKGKLARPRPGHVSPGALKAYPTGSGCSLTGVKNVGNPMQYDFTFAGSGWTASGVWYDFGDGVEFVAKDTAPVSHVYRTAGTYTAQANGWNATQGGRAVATATPTVARRVDGAPTTRRKKVTDDDAAKGAE
jgi:hypothetical protein